MNYFELQKKTNDMARDMASSIDYSVGWLLAKTINQPTCYQGKGRPRKTDYALLEHPFDKKVKNVLNR